MARKPAKPLTALRRQAREADTSDVIAAQARELEHGSDRAVAILAVSILERSLEEALLTWLRPLDADAHATLFGERGVLGTLSAKVDMAFALTVFGPETREDLHTLRSIRNHCAHARLPFSFGDEPIARTLYGMNFRRQSRYRHFVNPRRAFIQAYEHFDASLLLLAPRGMQDFAAEKGEMK